MTPQWIATIGTLVAVAVALGGLAIRIGRVLQAHDGLDKRVTQLETKDVDRDKVLTDHHVRIAVVEAQRSV